MKPARRVLLGLIGLAWPLFAIPAENDFMTITFIDVGQGDAALVEFPPFLDGSRARMLIDGGPDSTDDNAIVRLLREKNISMLDFVVLTHPHEDHYQGLIPVFENFIVEEFWWSGESRGPSRWEGTPRSWEEFEAAMNRVNEKVLLRQGHKLEVRGAKLRVLNAGREYPNTTKERDINNDSLVMMFYYKSVKTLFAGDIEEAEGRDLVSDYCSWFGCRRLNADIVKVPFHGAGHFSTEFIRTVDAESVIVSVGFRNREQHHPRATALLAFQEHGAEAFYSTGVDDKTGNHNITLTIGPLRNEFTIEGADRGFTYWRDTDDDPTCRGEIHEGFCLELWE